MTRDVRLRWFKRGAKALAAFAPKYANSGYGCPLCLRATADVDSLTAEHVPPASLGGRPLVLTCKGCNNRGGHALDVHWANFSALEAFAAGEPDSLTARMTVADKAITVQIDKDIDLIKLRVIGQASAPAAITAHKNALRAHKPEAELEINLAFTKSRLVEPKLRASVLRAAYLAGFAVFGYRYLGLWTPIREAVISYEGAPHTRLLIYDRTLPRSRRVFGYVKQPLEFESVAVGVGRWTAFLPLSAGSTLFSTPIEGEGITPLTVVGFAWPKEPTFGLPIEHG